MKDLNKKVFTTKLLNCYLQGITFVTTVKGKEYNGIINYDGSVNEITKWIDGNYTRLQHNQEFKSVNDFIEYFEN